MRLTAEYRQFALAHRGLLKTAWAAYRRQYPVSRGNALRQLLAAAHYRARTRKLAASMLVLASSLDRLVDPRCSQRLASQWQTAFAMHPSAGHDLPLDEGPWVARQVRDWLATAV